MEGLGKYLKAAERALATATSRVVTMQVCVDKMGNYVASAPGTDQRFVDKHSGSKVFKVLRDVDGNVRLSGLGFVSSMPAPGFKIRR